MGADVTAILADAGSRDSAALAQVYEILYKELQTIARAQLRRLDQQTLNTAALINESYLKLIDNSRISVEGRAHFLALAARAMRQILIDYFRRKTAAKRGSFIKPVTLLEEAVPAEQRGEMLVALDDAIDQLELTNERLARVVEYKFFGGMTYDEIAQVLDISARSARLDWRKAKAWLTLELEPET